MKTRSFFVASVVLGLNITVGLSQNVRLGFPQIAVGDSFTTVVQLTNKGVQTFEGSLAVVDNDGFFLPVLINGISVSNFYQLDVPPGSVQRFRLTRFGTVIPGHIIVWDRRSQANINFNEQIDGTVIFQWKDGDTLLDSIGVPVSIPIEHFYFIGEYEGNINTGLALSNVRDEEITVTIKAFSETGQFIDGRTIVLAPFNHQSFFINERLSIAQGFKGTVEVESSKWILAVALRLEGNQLSTLQVSAFGGIYDFDIFLDDGRSFSGEMTFAIGAGLVGGLVRFTSQTPDTNFEVSPITGGAADGAFIANIYTSFGGNFATILLFSISARTTTDTISATVSWDDNFGRTTGVFSGTRRK
ncbi:hypothetical protein MYX84_07090 [Acidobacteria bacterium AH-259-O06]|nr:hypothetical protein [Acidobacteria bacterium AH-259-O06]